MKHYTKEFRDMVCQEYLNTDIGRNEICDKYGLPRDTVKCWLHRYYPNEYKNDPKARTYTRHDVPLADKTIYKDMTKEQMQVELIKKDFEIARLKKKYPWLNDTE